MTEPELWLAHFASPIFIPSDARGGQDPTMNMGPDGKGPPQPNQTDVLVVEVLRREGGRIVMKAKVNDKLTLTIDKPEAGVTLVRGVESKLTLVGR